MEGRRQAQAPADRRSGATSSTCSPRARATCSTAGSSPIRSRRRWTSMPSSAISRARTRRARRMCCCTTSSARSTASADSGDTRCGGMGAITQAMAREALERGVEIFTDEAVARVLTKDGSAVGIVAGRWQRDRRAAGRRQRQSKAPLPPADRCRGARRRFPATDRELPLRLGDVSHQRRARRRSRLRLPARRRRAPALGHHHRAIARLHGARLFRCAPARLVARADRRAADSFAGRSHARAAGQARREPLLPARQSDAAGRPLVGRA